jgi:hypothetical protein
MLKFPAEPLALVGRDRLDVFRPAPGLVEDVGDRSYSLGGLLQAAAPLEYLLFRPVEVRDGGPGVVATSVIHHTYYSGPGFILVALFLWRENYNTVVARFP